MFGSLFDEENGEFLYNVEKSGSTSEKEKKITASPPPPPPPRPHTNICGIQNQGATCYLNSLLQTLLFTPEFRDGLFSLSREELGWVENGNEKSADKKLRVIPVELQKLFSQLLLADVEAVSTADLTESFGWVDNEELQQHDVQELNRILFSAIEKSLVGTSGMDLISSLYRGTVVNQVECLECRHVSEREETYFDLTLSVSGHTSLEKSLKSTFLIPEKMDGNNRYHCGSCDRLVDANKGAKLRSLPPVLTLSLLRFSYNPMKGERYKDTSKFSFPTRLDLNPFCDSSGDESSDNVYQLLSVVVHKGNAHGGHYHAYVRDIGSFGHWNLSSSQEEIKKKVHINGNEESTVLPEVFVEEAEAKVETNDDNGLPLPAALLRDILRRDNHFAPSGTMPLVDLCSKLSEVTSGSTWRETFQPKFGHLSRFLSMNPSLFYFNKVTRAVGLQPAGTKPLVPPRVHWESRRGSMDVKGSHRHKKRKKKKGRGGWKVKRGGMEEKADVGGEGEGSSSEEEEEGSHWFDFDDASVTPIPVSALEAQFSGRESAYMLFYRKEGLGCGKSKKTLVPEHLARLVEEKNLQLRKQREEHERILNEVFIQVLPSSAYVVRNGGLHKRSGNEICEEIRVSVDKRWNICKLNHEIIKVCEGTKGWEMEGRLLYTCQETPCGLHLIDPLHQTKSNPDSRLVKDIINEDDFRLFAWNGSDVGGLPYHAGSENEPILLRILLPPVGGARHEVTRGFSKSLPLSHVRATIAELCYLPLLSFYLTYEPPTESKEISKSHHRVTRSSCSANEKGTTNAQTNGVDDGNFKLYKPIRLSLTSNGVSLSAIGMASGGRILVDSKSIFPNASQEEPQKNTVIWVEDWTQTGGKVDLKKTLKQSWSSNIKRDGQSMVKLGIGDRVVRMDIPVETTVQQLKDAAVKELELPLNNYRLRKQEDESVESSDDSAVNSKISLRCPLQEHLALSEANVHFGSKVVLEEGKPVGENEIWLTFSPPSCTGESPHEFEIIVDTKCSIRELLKEMLTLAHLSGEEWHIRKTKWNGDLGEPLDDLNAIVCNESITHGQHLILCEKSLPQRGFIRLHLYLCSHIDNSINLNQNSTDHSPLLNGDQEMEQDNGELEENHITGKWIKQELERPLIMEITHNQLDNLGCLEIEQDLSLNQLKRRIMTLCPRISSLGLFSPKQIRLRLLKKVENAAKVTDVTSETVKFSRVLRNHSEKNVFHEKTTEPNSLNLASLQVHSGALIGVQILTKEEELGPHDVVLELCQRKPEGKGYFPLVELVWNNSANSLPTKVTKSNVVLCKDDFTLTTYCPSSSTPPVSDSTTNPPEDEDNPLLCFKKAISSKLGLQEDRVLIAKYISAKTDWILFQDSQTPNEKAIQDKSWHQRRRLRENTISLKSDHHFLARLKDGDIIGVKDLLNPVEGDELHKFSLAEEFEASNRHGSNGEKKKNGLSIELELSSKWKDTPKKSEKGIHIQVVDYS